MKVYYMNGAGNDFMVMDARDNENRDFSHLAVELCKITHADGFMAVGKSRKADFRLHFYNADGTRGEMCGNGARCICRFAYDMGIAGENMVVETDAGLVPGQRLDENRYRVRLNDPSVVDLHRKGGIAYVELGNPGVPHAVTQYAGDLFGDADGLRDAMRLLRYDPAFPKGANVNFYQVIAPGEVKLLTFERGVEDFTLACGTGTGSTAVVLWLTGQLPKGTLTAHSMGGTLGITIEGTKDHVDALYLEGPTHMGQSYALDI